jgi:hypothetical protein
VPGGAGACPWSVKREKPGEGPQGGPPRGERLLLCEAVYAVNFGRPMRSIAAEAGMRRPEELFRLVQVDKSAVTLPFVRGWIKEAQHRGDWQFFSELGRALSKPPLNEPEGLYGPLILTGAPGDRPGPAGRPALRGCAGRPVRPGRE